MVHETVRTAYHIRRISGFGHFQATYLAPYICQVLVGGMMKEK